MNEYQFRDLTRKAMIREYMFLRSNAISLVDATNDFYNFIENHFPHDDEFQERVEAYDQIVDNLKI